jgi:hypothetical protein
MATSTAKEAPAAAVEGGSTVKATWAGAPVAPAGGALATPTTTLANSEAVPAALASNAGLPDRLLVLLIEASLRRQSAGAPRALAAGPAGRRTPGLLLLRRWPPTPRGCRPARGLQAGRGWPQCPPQESGSRPPAQHRGNPLFFRSAPAKPLGMAPGNCHQHRSRRTDLSTAVGGRARSAPKWACGSRPMRTVARRVWSRPCFAARNPNGRGALWLASSRGDTVPLATLAPPSVAEPAFAPRAAVEAGLSEDHVGRPQCEPRPLVDASLAQPNVSCCSRLRTIRAPVCSCRPGYRAPLTLAPLTSVGWGTGAGGHRPPG